MRFHQKVNETKEEWESVVCLVRWCIRYYLGGVERVGVTDC